MFRTREGAKLGNDVDISKSGEVLGKLLQQDWPKSYWLNTVLLLFLFCCCCFYLCCFSCRFSLLLLIAVDDNTEKEPYRITSVFQCIYHLCSKVLKFLGKICYLWERKKGKPSKLSLVFLESFLLDLLVPTSIVGNTHTPSLPDNIFSLTFAVIDINLFFP